MRDSRNVGAPLTSTRENALGGRIAEGATGRELAAREDSLTLSGASAIFCGRLAVRGRFNLRSGSVGVS